MILIHILKFPFICFTVFILEPLAKLILKEDLKRLNDTKNKLYTEIRVLNEQNEEYSNELDLINERHKRLAKLIQEKELINCDLSLTDKNEIVFISKSETSGTTLKLYGTESIHHYRDSHIFYSSIYDNSKKVIKIHDLISDTIKKGYGRALMTHFIEKMKNEGINVVWGDLSPVDKESFNWLIPFYESLGFTCTLFDQPSGKMLGRVEMVLNK